MDYKYGNKNNWRRWLWNRISERVINPRESVVLYLAGEADLDRKIALEHGFRDHNLIAIESDHRTLTSLRNKGVLTVNGDFSEVVNAWPHDRNVDVLIGDFCCGLEYDLIFLARTFLSPPFFHAVFAFNFLRGRDPSTNKYRAELTKQIDPDYAISPKHRGMIFLGFVLKYMAMGMKDDSRSIDDWLPEVLSICTPTHRSYKSTANQIFDSIVYASPLFPFEVPEDYKNFPSYCDEGKGTKIRRKITAILAHQTMRSTDGLART